MKKPVLDSRTKKDVMETIRHLASSYTPEWKFEEGSTLDPGVALADMFAQIYTQTVDRFNSLPEKYYTEFLNLVGVSSPDPTASTGYVCFDVQDVAKKAVPVPKCTRLSGDSLKDGMVYFETTRPIEATAAKMKSAFFFSGRSNKLQRLDFEKEPQRLFAETEDAENLYHHRLFISREDVLSIEGACSIEVEIEQATHMQEDETAHRMVDPDNAVWTWFNGEKWVPFENVTAEKNHIRMEKKEEGPICPDEEGRRCICCELKHVDGNIVFKSISLSSTPKRMRPVDAMAYGDIPLEKEGGYCFGKRPNVYDLFYFRSDDIFCKRGASICLRMDVTTIVDDPTKGEVRYDWSQNVINKDSVLPITPDDVTVRRVVWEYYNGKGWVVLNVTGNQNPFSGQDWRGKRVEAIFTIPDNISKVSVNSEEGYFIRVRVVEMENAQSMNPRWLLPFIKSASCNWKYSRGYRAEYLVAKNNGGVREIKDADKMGELNFRAFEGIDDLCESVYLKFDRSPDAMPLSLMFQIVEPGNLTTRVQFEALKGDKFYPVRVADGTHNFHGTGMLCLYLSEPLKEKELFGETGYWLRLSLFTGTTIDPKSAPVVKDILVNGVSVVQRQHADDQFFSVSSYEPGKEISLLFLPVLDCEVWVNEADLLTRNQIQEMQEKTPDRVDVVWNDQVLQKCWVLWDRVSDIRIAGPTDRVYELDANRGTIYFGNGEHGQILTQGTHRIRVRYTYGGGEAGNLPVGGITSLAGSIPMIGAAKSVTTTSGGIGEMSRSWIENYGNRRVRHRNRALGAVDMEDMVIEHFPNVRHVSCFSGRDEKGNAADGQVSVVFMCSDTADIIDTAAVAGDIYNWLSQRCDCTLVASGGLHVLPAAEIEVCVETQVELLDLDLAADTQKALEQRIKDLIDNDWRQRPIGDQVKLVELYRVLSQTPNIAAVRKVLAEGRWTEGGVHRSCDLSEGRVFPYATVRSGRHAIRIV